MNRFHHFVSTAGAAAAAGAGATGPTTVVTTVVTMFFDLKRLKDASPATRPMDFYVQNGATVLRLPYPMVIFCDEVTHPYLEAIRNGEVDASVAPTVYVIQRLEDYEYYRQAWPVITDNRHERGHPADQRNTASYFLMGMFKPLALWIAKQRNDFGTPYYAWIDLGCAHICRQLAKYAPAMLEQPRNKIACCYIHYRSHEELSDMAEYMRYGGPCGIASTAYTMPAAYVAKFYTAMLQVFYEKLFHGVGHTDETVMAYVYDRYPELFTIYYGDYGSIFTNYHVPREDLSGIVYCFIQQAEQKKRRDLAQSAARAILSYINSAEGATQAVAQNAAEFKDYLEWLVQQP